jgi:hypothetical protein
MAVYKRGDGWCYTFRFANGIAGVLNNAIQDRAKQADANG